MGAAHKPKGNYAGAILLSFIVVATMLIFTFCSSGTCTTGKAVQVTLPSNTVNVGDTVVATIGISGATDLAGYDVDLTYDSSVLSLGDITHGSWLGSSLFTPSVTDTSTPGVITDVVAVRQSATGKSGSGTLFTVTFTAIGAGTANIQIADADYANSDGNPESHTSSGTILTIQAQTPDVTTPPEDNETNPGTNSTTTNSTDSSGSDTTTPPETNEPGDTNTGSSGSSGGGGGGGGGRVGASSSGSSGGSSVFRSWMNSISGAQSETEQQDAPRSTVTFKGQSGELVQDAQLTVATGETASLSITQPQENTLSLGTPNGFVVLDAVSVAAEGFTSDDIVSATMTLRITLDKMQGYTSQDLRVYGLSQGAWKNVKIIKRDLQTDAVELTVEPAELGLLAVGVQETAPLEPVEEQKPRAVIQAEEQTAKRWNAFSWLIAGIALVVLVVGVGGGIYWHERSKKKPIADKDMSMAERYVHRLRGQGFSDTQIREGLEKAGWPENLIADVLSEPAQTQSPSQA